MSPEDYLWKMGEQNLSYCRHHENMRQAITNFAIALGGVLLTIIALDGEITRMDILPILLLIIVGFHAMLTSWKHFERYRFHYTRFREIRQLLDEKTGVSIDSLNQIADKRHQAQFPRFYQLSLHRFWFVLHLMIILIGICLMIFALSATQ
jgi:hypothetical protein